MRYDQHQEPSNDRPRLYQQPMPNVYNQLIPTSSRYEPAPPYYSSPLLHMSSSDYRPTMASNCSASSTPSNTAKRSREDLNRKEKQRMSKLNERINQLKTLLDDAGVQTKKNKQSILDNTSNYIEMLRDDLLAAQQKAEEAKNQADLLFVKDNMEQAVTDKITSGVFQKTTTPRVVLDMDMKTIVFNSAFVKFTGLSELVLKKKKSLRPYLCADEVKFQCTMKKVRDTKQSVSAVVKTSVAKVNLIASAVTDNKGNVTNVEFSLIPMETQQQQQRPLLTKRQKIRAAHNGAKGS
ncbi:unnamed protein product [Peronospora belbahrii]|uniref:BHLH domain-containing protein n=1 Tax=Peronospora belbahrii TaxID=622444 RepID=A0AAU9KXG2_9STRA|nr:unnamed protein product [Peronospora belbahrii]CAH0478474.1 unnamed protein product [Peronospora belbahrii]CAH0519412.1 unnamed protein product [Peronospora belbahrii]